MRARDKQRLGALRLAWNSVRNAEIDARTELDDEGVIKILKSELKKRRDSAEAYRAGDREELAAQEEFEAEVLSEFVPAGPSEDAIRAAVTAVIEEVGASSMRDMGKVMSKVMGQVSGADGRLVSSIVKEQLGAG